MKNIFMLLFDEKKTTLYNGQLVKEGDVVEWVDSDGKSRTDVIKRRIFDVLHCDTKQILKKGTLFMCNNAYNPSDYITATKL